MHATWLDRTLLARAKSVSAGEDVRHIATTRGTLRVRDVGNSSRAIVFVCDMPMLIEHYAELIELLRPDFRVLCIELPGLGFSTAGPAFDYSLTSQAAAVREVLAALNVRDCVLAFGCVGAYLALLLAHQLPDVVARVVLMQAGAWDGELRWARRIDFRGRGVVATPYLGQVMVRALRKQIARRWIAKALGKKELTAEFVRRANAGLDAGAAWALASLTQSYFGTQAPEFRPLEQEALVVWGERDRTHAETDPRGVLEWLPRGQLVCFEQAGHFPELEEPQEFTRVMCEFAGFERSPAT